MPKSNPMLRTAAIAAAAFAAAFAFVFVHAAIAEPPGAQAASPDDAHLTTAPANDIEPPAVLVGDRRKQVERWLRMLDAELPKDRERARANLLTLNNEDLLLLKDAVKAEAPLAPSQLLVLPDIVLHDFLMSQRYFTAPGAFLGVRLSAPPLGEENLPQAAAVVIDSRIIGFAGYQYFEDGDVVTRIEEYPDVINNRNFIAFIQAQEAGRVVHFHVLRRGKTIRLAVVLSGRPREANNIQDPQGAMNVLTNLRMEAAKKYWDDNFGDLTQVHVAVR